MTGRVRRSSSARRVAYGSRELVRRVSLASARCFTSGRPRRVEHEPETEVVGAGVGYAFAPAVRPVARAVLVRAQERAATMDLLGHAWLGRIEALRFARTRRIELDR